MKYLMLVIWLLAGLSCNQDGIKYSIYANGELIFEIFPEDISFYDTTQSRGSIQIHEMRLRDEFYNKDSIFLAYPIEMICTINGKKYFWGEHFCRAQSDSRLYVNFRFDPDCENSWKFSEGGPAKPREGDTIVLYTNNICNSIELFHKEKTVDLIIDEYKKRDQSFSNNLDTIRLAHEILLDPYYLRVLEESGISIK